MVGGSGNRSSDYSKAMEKHGDGSFDFRKGVRKPATRKVDTEVTEGATEDSIAKFVAASNAAKHAPRNPKSFGEKVRSFFGRP